MTSLSPDPASPDHPVNPADRPAASSAVAKEHADERFNSYDRRAAQEASMTRTRWWTMAAVIAVGMVLWLVFTR